MPEHSTSNSTKKKHRLRAMTVNRVDLVDSPANPGARALLFKREEEPGTRTVNVENREFSQEEREKLAEEGKALPDGSYPIVNTTDLKNAMQAFGRANPSDRDKVRRHILKRARALNASKELIDRIKDLGKMEKIGRAISRRNLQRIEEALAVLAEMVEEQKVGKSHPDNVVGYSRKNKEEISMESIEKLKEKVAGLSELSGEDLTKALGEIAEAVEAVPDELNEQIEKVKQDTVEEFSQALSELDDEDSDEDPDDVTKREDLPEDVRKRFEELEKAENEARERIEKMERDRKRREFIAKAEQSYRHVHPADELGAALMDITDSAPEAAEVIERALESANAKIGEGNLYKSYGQRGQSATTSESRVEEMAKSLQKAKPDLSEEQATAEVLKENPELWEEYASEKTKA